MSKPPDGVDVGEPAGLSESLPARICVACARGLQVDGAGLSLMTPAGTLAAVAASDATAARIEELQFDLGEGPCVDAFAGGAPVLIADMTDSTQSATARWPGFARAATDAGVQALFALPLQVGAIRLGVLDLHRLRPGPLSSPELAASLMAADAAALSLLDISADGAGNGLSDDSEAGSAYRFEVHQATGMLMVQLGVAVDEAFVRLRAHAFGNGLSVANVARDIVARRLRLEPRAAGGDQ